MLELLINPKTAERKPWEMLFVGLIYASIAVLVPYLLFGKDYVQSNYLSWITILFLVMLTLPYVYYTIKLEEKKDGEYEEESRLLKEHSKAILSLLFLFLGFVIAFSVLYIVLPDGPNLFKAQVETFCQINSQGDIDNCIKRYGLEKQEIITGSVTSKDRLLSIFANNVNVLILTLVLSLVFGAGAIFILAWNASVIAAAIGIFTKSQLSQIPLGLSRYLAFHGLLEICAYFIAALAGGILSLTVIKRGVRGEKLWAVIQDALTLVVVSLAILLIAAIIEVFITPRLF